MLSRKAQGPPTENGVAQRQTKKFDGRRIGNVMDLFFGFSCIVVSPRLVGWAKCSNRSHPLMMFVVAGCGSDNGRSLVAITAIGLVDSFVCLQEFLCFCRKACECSCEEYSFRSSHKEEDMYRRNMPEPITPSCMSKTSMVPGIGRSIRSRARVHRDPLIRLHHRGEADFRTSAQREWPSSTKIVEWNSSRAQQ